MLSSSIGLSLLPFGGAVTVNTFAFELSLTSVYLRLPTGHCVWIKRGEAAVQTAYDRLMELHGSTKVGGKTLHDRMLKP